MHVMLKYCPYVLPGAGVGDVYPYKPNSAVMLTEVLKLCVD